MEFTIMTNINSSSNNSVLNLFTGHPIAQRFIEDPALFLMARGGGWADASDDEIVDAEEYAAMRMRADQETLDAG